MSNPISKNKLFDSGRVMRYIGTIMSDLNKIRSLNVLEEMKTVLNEFLHYNKEDLLAVYNANGDGPEDFEADCELAQDLLAKVERRMKSLGNHLAKEKNSQISCDDPKTEVGSSLS